MLVNIYIHIRPYVHTSICKNIYPCRKWQDACVILLERKGVHTFNFKEFSNLQITLYLNHIPLITHAKYALQQILPMENQVI